MTDRPDFVGDLDGEIPETLVVRFSGAGTLDRAFAEGERVAITAIGTVRSISFRRRDGALQRVHTLAVETVAEPTGQMLTDISDMLRAVEDERAGRAPLPLDLGELDEDEEDGDEGAPT